jgi:nitrate reductase delta subunit
VTPWQLLSLLLEYPNSELYDARDELEEAAAGRPDIQRFVASWRTATLEELQRRYVETFDFDRRASLHLTYHALGDKRQRGLELVRLKRRFADAGLPLAAAELPDFLPVLLEFAALTPKAGEAILNELRPSLELVRARLHERQSPYAPLLDAVVGALPKPTRAQLEAARRLAAEGPPAELVGLEPFPAGAVA